MTPPFLSAEEYDEQAHRHYDEGDYDAALDVLREGLAAHADSVLLQVGMGYVRIAREEYAWARRGFERALEVDPDYEDAWVGLGETMLKFGRVDRALECFGRIDAMGLSDDLELGLTIGRALYREGLFSEARARFNVLFAAHADSAEVAAARGYTLHALGDDLAARRELRRALKLDPELHEARIYLAHLLYDRGDHQAALGELERVPPAEHWDTLSLWRYVELRSAADGSHPDDASFAPWKARLAELEEEPDQIDHLLAEVEAAFEDPQDELPRPFEPAAQADFLARVLGDVQGEVHRVRTMEGSVFEGTWDEIVEAMRDTVSGPDEPLASFMHRAARAIRESTGRDVPCDSAEAFVRGGARIGLLRIEA